MKTAKPKVRISQTGTCRSMLVSIGEHNSRRNVGMIVSPTGKEDALFLYCELGVRERKGRLTWQASIHPEQIDNLISCLATAKKNLKKIGAKQ